MRNNFQNIIFLVFFLVTQAKSQNMLQIGKQWIFEDMHYSNLLFSYSDTTIETITIISDTTINNLEYKRVETSRLPSCWNASEVEFLREDGEKIFRLSLDHQQEFLMIDFAETVSYQMLFDNGAGSIDTGTVVIDSFGTEYAFDGTLLEVQYMRILNNQSFDDEATYKVYKNIGFLQPGFLFPDLGTGLCDFQDRITLRCIANGVDTIHFSEFGCFELPIINNTQEIMYNSLILSPNPATDFITIPTGLIFLGIMDIFGVVSIPDQDGNRISIQNYSPGLYFLRFTGEQEKIIYTGKICKF